MTRASGKTFRKILQALNLASSGERVFFETHSANEARRVFNLSSAICGAYFGMNGLPIYLAQRKIEFPNAGSITFCVTPSTQEEHDKRKGLHDYVTIRDSV